MTKHRREIKGERNKDLTRLEQTEIFDDNLLPDANEIHKLSELDPQILPWLKSRAEKEQDFRHLAFDKRVKLTDDHNRRDHNTTRWALFIYLVLVAGCITASYFLILMGKDIQGTIFGSAAVILGLAVLLTRKPSQNQQTQSEKNK
jgi:uncharacterized membrane protein